MTAELTDERLAELIERLLAMRMDEGGAIIVREAADALEACAGELSELQEEHQTLYKAHNATVKSYGETRTALEASLAREERLIAVCKEAYEMSPFHSNGCAGTTEFEEGVIHDNTKGCDCYLSRLKAAALGESKP